MQIPYLLYIVHLQLFIFTHFVLLSRAEYFSSSGHMAYLFDIEKQLTTHLKAAIERHEARLSRMKDFYGQVEHLERTDDEKNYIGHPNNAFKILKRLSKEWSDIKTIASSSDQGLS